MKIEINNSKTIDVVEQSLTVKEGKLYKCYWDKGISELIGYNYCLCVQWDPIQLKPKSVVYIRALDKFSQNIKQVSYDYRGFDNQTGTYDDLTPNV